MIDTREELVNALSEAAELEHGLLIQYLFTAFSLKRRTDEGITPLQQLRINDWESVILSVAHQEMYHLANVCNLLAAVGGAPHFDRPNFPQSMKKYYPFDFQLERFNDNSLYRFIVFELPEGEEPPEPPIKEAPMRTMLEKFVLAAAPDPIVYNHIGTLYQQIAEGFRNIDEKKLFIGPESNRDTDHWTLRLKLHLVHDRQSALAAINAIVKEGEGAPGHRENSHYDLFLRTRSAYRALLADDPSFEPARNVVLNPQTRLHRAVQGPVTLITNDGTLPVAELFNTVYHTMLLMLVQYYGYGGETLMERELLRDSSRRMMSAIIRPLAEMLTELPATAKPEEGNAGPGFEIYGPLNLATDRGNRWTVLKERFGQHIADAQELAKFGSGNRVLARMARVAEALEGTLINLSAEFEKK